MKMILADVGWDDVYEHRKEVFGRIHSCTGTVFEEPFELWGNTNFTEDLFCEQRRVKRLAVLPCICDDKSNPRIKKVQHTYWRAIAKLYGQNRKWQSSSVFVYIHDEGNLHMSWFVEMGCEHHPQIQCMTNALPRWQFRSSSVLRKVGEK